MGNTLTTLSTKLHLAVKTLEETKVGFLSLFALILILAHILAAVSALTVINATEQVWVTVFILLYFLIGGIVLTELHADQTRKARESRI